MNDVKDRLFWRSQISKLRRLLKLAGDDPILVPQLRERLEDAKRKCEEAYLGDEKDLREYIRSHPPKRFAPIPIKSESGNFIIWYWKIEDCYAESVHHDGKWIGSVYRSMKTNEVVGVNIHLEAVK